jgi:branched-chain amino acid transport system permease protein
MTQSPFGMVLQSIRENEPRTRAIGYPVERFKIPAVMLSGLFAGVAGGLFAVNYEILTAENMGLNASGAVLLMTFIGGIGYFAGPIVGAIVFTFLQSMLSDYTGIWLLYLGILFLATVLFVPTGLAGVFMLHAPAWRARRLRRLVGPYLVTAAVGLVAVVGVVGLLEMVHFVAAAEATRVGKRLFWLSVPVRTPLPWLAFLALTVLGALGLRWTAPRAAAALAEATGSGTGASPKADGQKQAIRGETPNQDEGGSSIGDALSALAGSDSGGMGIFLPILLVATLLAAVLLLATRLRRGGRAGEA